MSVSSLFPILRTADLPGLLEFYERVFGASVGYRFPDEGDAVYVALAVGGGKLAIGVDAAHSGRGGIALWLYVDDVDATFEAALAAGATEVSPPADMPWGERVAELLDPDNNPLHLGAAT